MKLDARAKGRKALAEIRKRAVLRVEAGESPEDVISKLGMHRSNIYRWMSQYREGGLEALEEKKSPGRPPKLDDRQLERLYEIILNESPLRLNFEFSLWTREMVGRLIRDEFHVRMSEGSVGRLLRKLGLFPQKPLSKAFQRDEGTRKAWTEEIFPEIRKLARKEGAIVLYVDEASVQSDHHSGRTCASSDKSSAIEQTSSRFETNMIFAVSPLGEFRFMTFHPPMNAERFTEFLERVMHDVLERIFLILEGHSVYMSREVKEFVRATDGKLRVFVIPPYSPALNPDEWVMELVEESSPHPTGDIKL